MLVLFKIVCNHILTLKWHDRLVKLTHPRVTASGRLKMTWEEIFPLSTWRSSQSPTGSPTEALTVHFNSPGSTGRWTSALRRALRACVRACWRQCLLSKWTVCLLHLYAQVSCLPPRALTHQHLSQWEGWNLGSFPQSRRFPLICHQLRLQSVQFTWMGLRGDKRGHCSASLKKESTALTKASNWRK